MKAVVRTPRLKSSIIVDVLHEQIPRHCAVYLMSRSSIENMSVRGENIDT